MSAASDLPFGALLKRYRRAAGLTQEALAERAGYSAVYIRMLEGGARHPLAVTIALLSDALDLTPDQRATLTHAARTVRQHDQKASSEAHEPDEAPLPVGGFLGAAPPSPLIAREAEMRQLLDTLSVVANGAGRLALLEGEPGVGKTRLAQEVMLAARARGFLVVVGRCYEPARTVAYYPFREALALALAAAPSTLRAEVARRWPALDHFLADPGLTSVATNDAAGSASAKAQLERQRLFDALGGFLVALAAYRPLALLLDDLHWADSASLEALQHLARHTRAARVFLLGTYRAEEVTSHPPLETALRALLREGLMQRVSVACLSADGSAALLQASLGAGTVPPEVAAALHQRAEGNPFFTIELARSLVEQGQLVQEDGRWNQPPLADALALERVPESVRLVIGERVARLSAATQATLREASVLGQAFDFADLAGLQARAEEELEVALEEGCGADLLREAGRDKYGFAHTLIQQALYAALPARRRQRLHRAAGETIERASAREQERRVGELAYHFGRSDRLERALPYLIRAADQAAAAGAWHEEAALLGQAIALAERGGDDALITGLRLRRSRALRTISVWPEAERELAAALATLAPEQVEPRIQALLDRAEVAHWQYSEPGLRRYATEALTLAERVGRDDLAAQALCRLALADSSTGAVRTAVQQYERAFQRAGEAHIMTLVTGVEYSGLNLYWLGEYSAAIERSRWAIELALQSHETTYAARALANLGLGLTGSGQYREAFAAFDEARQFARDHRIGQWAARSTAMCGGAHLEVFDFAGAEALAEEAFALGQSLNWPQATTSAGIDLLLNFARRQEVGRVEGLLPQIAATAARAEGEHGWLWRLRLAQARAEIALACGVWNEARHWAEEVITESRARGRIKYAVAGLQARGQALAAQGQTRSAIASLQRAVAQARPVGDPAMLLRSAAALLAVEGNDALLAEARAEAARIVAALPTAELVAHFNQAALVRQLG